MKERERRRERKRKKHRFTVEAARLVGQRALEDVVDPRWLCLVLRLGLGGGGGAVVLQTPVLLLLLLLLLQDVGHCVQQVVEELVRVLLHVVVEQVWMTAGREKEAVENLAIVREKKGPKIATVFGFNN